MEIRIRIIDGLSELNETFTFIFIISTICFLSLIIRPEWTIISILCYGILFLASYIRIDISKVYGIKNEE